MLGVGALQRLQDKPASLVHKRPLSEASPGVLGRMYLWSRNPVAGHARREGPPLRRVQQQLYETSEARHHLGARGESTRTFPMIPSRDVLSLLYLK